MVKRQIVDAALSAFARDTYEGASMLDIARAAGVGGPLVHYHFGSKADLWFATVDEAMNELTNALSSLEPSLRDLSALDQLRAAARTFAAFCQQYPEHVLVLTNEVRSPGPRLDWLVERHLRPIHNFFDTAVEHAVAAGQVRSAPAVILTNAIIGLVTHFFLLGPVMQSLYNTDLTDDAKAQGMTDHILDILFNGMVPRS